MILYRQSSGFQAGSLYEQVLLKIAYDALTFVCVCNMCSIVQQNPSEVKCREIDKANLRKTKDAMRPKQLILR